MKATPLQPEKNPPVSRRKAPQPEELSAGPAHELRTLQFAKNFAKTATAPSAEIQDDSVKPEPGKKEPARDIAQCTQHIVRNGDRANRTITPDEAPSAGRRKPNSVRLTSTPRPGAGHPRNAKPPGPRGRTGG